MGLSDMGSIPGQDNECLGLLPWSTYYGIIIWYCSESNNNAWDASLVVLVEPPYRPAQRGAEHGLLIFLHSILDYKHICYYYYLLSHCHIVTFLVISFFCFFGQFSYNSMAQDMVWLCGHGMVIEWYGAVWYEVVWYGVVYRVVYRLHDCLLSIYCSYMTKYWRPQCGNESVVLL